MNESGTAENTGNNGNGRYPVETQLELIRREIRTIRSEASREREEMHRETQREFAAIQEQVAGPPGHPEKGLLHQVDQLGEIAERGRWGLRAALWAGGTLVAILTALAQLKNALGVFWSH